MNNYSNYKLLLVALEFAEEYHRVSDPVRAQLKELILGNNRKVGQDARDYANSVFGNIEILGGLMLEAVDAWDEERQ